MTYLWQGIALVLHFTSLLIVIPYITQNKPIYAIYSICISISIFLSYADFGFIKSAVKYGGEYFSKNDLISEIKLYGFTSFLLFISIIVIASSIFYLSLNPKLIISDLEIGSQYDIASTLLLILSIFSFTTVFQKYFDCIFLVRIEQYIYQRIKIVGNIFKICSVFYFFSDNNYNIVGYFLFIKCIDLIVQIITFFIVKKRYNISVSDFFSNFKFDNKIFNKTKSLAFNSIYLSLTFILYYELDIIAIGKYLSIEDVAIFSLAVFFLQFLRSISSIILSPFQSRFNHFIGLKNKKGMFVFYKKLIKVILPFFIFSGIIIAIYSKQIVISWAGNNYIESFQLLSLFGLFFILNAINVPSTNLLVSLEKLKDLYFINTLIVVFFWVGVYFTISHLGVISFAFFKFLSAIITSIYLIIIISKIIKLKPILYIYKYGKLFILPLISLFIVYEILHSYIVLEKGVLNFLMVSLIMITTFIFAFLVLLYTSKFYRNEYKMYLEKVLKIKN